MKTWKSAPKKPKIGNPHKKPKKLKIDQQKTKCYQNLKKKQFEKMNNEITKTTLILQKIETLKTD